MEARDLYNVLNRKAGFEVVNDHVGEKQIRIIGRVPNNRTPSWLVVVQRLLVRADEAPWNADISKQYFHRNGKLLFGWRLIFQCDGIAEHLSDIGKAIADAPSMKTEITEVNIQRSAHRTQMHRGRGAQSIRGDAGTPSIVSSKLGV